MKTCLDSKAVIFGGTVARYGDQWNGGQRNVRSAGARDVEAIQPSRQSDVAQNQVRNLFVRSLDAARSIVRDRDTATAHTHQFCQTIRGVEIILDQKNRRVTASARCRVRAAGSKAVNGNRKA